MNRILFIFLVLVSFNTEAQTSVLVVADSLYASGNYSKAIEKYKLYNQPSEVFESMAKSYQILGNYDEAQINYSKALEAHPDDALLKYDYAKLLTSIKKYKEATQLFEELVNNDYRNPNYQYELGVVLEQQGDSTALNRYRNAFDLDRTHQKAIYKIAKQFLIDRKFDASLDYIKIGLESYANNVELISLKAQNYYWKEKYIEASKCFEKLIELGESSLFIHEKLSFCYAQDSEYQKAIQQGDLALKYDPVNVKNLFIQGQLYERIEDFENAEKYMALALEIRDIPLDNEYMRLGLVLNRQGKYKEAIEAFHKSLKINPKNQQSPFYIVVAKDKYYEDIESRLKLYESYKENYPKSMYMFLVDKRIKELKEEKFYKTD